MNPLKRGPEIRLSDLRVPAFLRDLYYDLRSRHLLPLVAVLAAAIVAVPIALSQSSGSGGPRAVTGLVVAAPSGTSNRSGELVVAKAAPGLRAYRHRLSDLHAKDPFRRASGGSASSSSGHGGSSTASSESGSTGSGTPGSSSGGSSSGTRTLTVTHTLTYFSWAIDVRIVPVSSDGSSASSASGAASSSVSTSTAGSATAGKAKPTVRRNLPLLTTLPDRGTPAAVFISVSKDGRKALLMLSEEVKAVFGEGTCLLGSQACQLLALEPGIPETFVYGPHERTFRIELLKLHLIATRHLRRAPLGKP
jgi:hypothetical protein